MGPGRLLVALGLWGALASANGSGNRGPVVVVVPLSNADAGDVAAWDRQRLEDATQRAADGARKALAGSGSVVVHRFTSRDNCQNIELFECVARIAARHRADYVLTGVVRISRSNNVGMTVIRPSSHLVVVAPEQVPPPAPSPPMAGIGVVAWRGDGSQLRAGARPEDLSTVAAQALNDLIARPLLIPPRYECPSNCGKPGERIRSASPQVDGWYERAEVGRALRPTWDGFTRCYAEQRRHMPALEGWLDLFFVITAQGRVVDVRIDGAAAEPRMERCFQATLSTLKPLSPVSGRRVLVRQPMCLQHCPDPDRAGPP